MSFTTDVKEELSRVEPACDQCQTAMLSALVKSHGTLNLIGNGKYTVRFTTDNAWIARFALEKFKVVYNLNTSLTFRRSVLHNTRNYLIELQYDKNLEKALIDLGILSSPNSKTKVASISHGIKKEFKNKDCCAAAYLRGAFLGSGYLSEPSGDFHFEISVDRKSQASDMQKILAKKGIKSGVCARRKSYILYIKSGQGITDFLAFSGAHKCALKMENMRVSKQIANQINRQTNAEIANSKRTVEAAYNQIVMIKKITKHYELEKLPPALKEFMALRVKYHDVSLSELGNLADPPISKSAINGRVRRLEHLANAIKN